MTVQKLSVDVGDVHLVVAKPAWLFANTTKVLGRIGLTVKKAGLPMPCSYIEPVEDFITQHGLTVKHEWSRADESMLMGLSEWRLYLTGDDEQDWSEFEQDLMDSQDLAVMDEAERLMDDDEAAS